MLCRLTEVRWNQSGRSMASPAFGISSSRSTSLSPSVLRGSSLTGSSFVLAIRLLSRGTTQRKLNKATRAKIVKCSESMWKLTYYATLEVCVLATAYQEPWFRDIKQYFSGWPDQELKLSLKLIYMCQCGFYIYSIVALSTWETRRKDFSVMMSHHVVTVIVIGYSYIIRFFRIGAVILALHDASDVFLEAGKVFKYSENELGASLFFGLFASSWLVLRLIYFPFWVIRSFSCYSVEVLDLSEPYYIGVCVSNTMLLTLLVFHIYWWKLICAMIIRQLKSRGKVGKDIRSGLHIFYVNFQIYCSIIQLPPRCGLTCYASDFYSEDDG
ncbi:hypothetical protein BUALT_Bualt15G0038900 [Buddleja alternifolia]|uniref:TLC domain-containing protein n=1 Tax=Buddleja alternifolia TaxID=168488 RepID=A0AAV6WKJ9_9LAMI|nr:hypothetical protein BUALT_Bualt15G0038900 [Buddleja alternifolia]